MAKVDELYSKAIAQWEFGNFVEAINFFKKILRKNPDNSEILSYVGILYLQLGDYDKGLTSLELARNLSPNDHNILVNLSNGLLDQANHFIKNNFLESAIKALQESIEILPTNESSHINLLKLLIKQKDFESFEDYFNRAIKLNPNQEVFYFLFGNALFDQCKFDEARAYFLKAVNLKIDYSEAILHQALCEQFLGNYQQALDKYNECLKINPTYHLALFNKSQLLLEGLDYELGWNLYINRWASKQYTGKYIFDSSRELKSEKNFNKKILIWAEQGIGDQILFSSMLNDFSILVKNLTVAVDGRLKSIFERSMSNINFVDLNDDLSSITFDYHLPMGNLGLFVRRKKETFKNQRRFFLISNIQQREKFLKKINNPEKIVCGYSLNSKNKYYGEQKSINLNLFAEKLKSANLKFINLDYAENKQESDEVEKKYQFDVDRVDWIDKFNDLESLASLISACDIVVTISNVTAHLAGALGVKTFLLAPYGYGRFWYWSDDGESRWYPSVNIIRQTDQFTWDKSFEKLLKYISQLKK